jgi:hypothetical protein
MYHLRFDNASRLFNDRCEGDIHGLRTPREEIAFTARPKIHSHSKIFRHGRSIICLSHWPNFSGIFDLYLHWVSVVHGGRVCSVAFCDNTVQCRGTPGGLVCIKGGVPVYYLYTRNNLGLD